MFIHRKAEDEKKAADEGLDGIPTTLVIAKHRNGPTEDVPIMFKKTFPLFTDVEQQ
jgi:replicative DNA helicase